MEIGAGVSVPCMLIKGVGPCVPQTYVWGNQGARGAALVHTVPIQCSGGFWG